jgi:tetratricopeptide (TPR) repeat protein
MGKEAEEEVEKLLEECLEDDPNHVAALGMLATLRSLRRNQAGLAALVSAFGRPEVPDPYFHFMGAVCYLAAGHSRQAIEACRLAWGEPALTVECRYLMGWAYYRLQDWSAARREWDIVATSPESPSAPYAQAMLGRILFEQKCFGEAVGYWQGLESSRRRQWHLEEILPKTVFLAGLQALNQGNNQLAADRFRQAEQLGLENGALNLYLAGALVKSGLERLYPEEGRPALELA